MFWDLKVARTRKHFTPIRALVLAVVKVLMVMLPVIYAGYVARRTLQCTLQHVHGGITVASHHQLSHRSKIVDGFFSYELLTPVLEKWFGRFLVMLVTPRTFAFVSG